MRLRVLFPVVFVLACGTRTMPGPPFTGQATSALVQVPYPPPPARVEVMPASPDRPGAVWIDGEWTWRSRRWSWKPGRWVSPPPNARFAPWTTVRDRLGTLWFSGGIWRDVSGAELPDPEPLAPSRPLPATVVTPEGDEVQQGPPEPVRTDAGSPTTMDAGAEP